MPPMESQCTPDGLRNGHDIPGYLFLTFGILLSVRCHWRTSLGVSAQDNGPCFMLCMGLLLVLGTGTMARIQWYYDYIKHGELSKGLGHLCLYLSWFQVGLSLLLQRAGALAADAHLVAAAIAATQDGLVLWFGAPHHSHMWGPIGAQLHYLLAVTCLPLALAPVLLAAYPNSLRLRLAWLTSLILHGGFYLTISHILHDDKGGCFFDAHLLEPVFGLIILAAVSLQLVLYLATAALVLCIGSAGKRAGHYESATLLGATAREINEGSCMMSV